ncbi:MAG: ZTL protein [Xanthomonadales bacterium]|nr:ZTL protein [Xanthomonadales bacterium]
MITVIAGVNGAGKSSVVGAYLRKIGGDYFNPDEYTRYLLATHPDWDLGRANAEAWGYGAQRLEEALALGLNYAFETTLGGQTIINLLVAGAEAGQPVSVFYVGLDSAQLHIDRVAARVSRGGHAIPEDRIRSRYTTSVLNMTRLAECCTRLQVWDNSTPLDAHGHAQPKRLLSTQEASVQFVLQHGMPEWAKPIATASLLRMQRG